MANHLLPLVTGDLQIATWARVRKGLVAELWNQRALLETNCPTGETEAIRARIQLLKQLLAVDPNKDDYTLKHGSSFEAVARNLAVAISPPPDKAAGETPPLP